MGVYTTATILRCSLEDESWSLPLGPAPTHPVQGRWCWLTWGWWDLAWLLGLLLEPLDTCRLAPWVWSPRGWSRDTPMPV